MADNSVLTEAGQFEQQFRRMSSMLRCAMPGTITSFNAGTQRATVIPGVKLKIVQGEEVTYVNLPEIQNVPITVPYGFTSGVLLTHPINSGDPCLLVFSDRAIDNFLQTGRSENPGSMLNHETTTSRAHHLSDAICIPGLIADPQTVPSWNQENIELRDFERKTYISLGPSGITMTDGTAVYTMKGGKVTLDAPGGIEETATISSRTTTGKNTVVGSNVSIGRPGSSTDELENSLKSRNGTFIDTNGRDSTAHVHSGVQSGSNISGPTAG